MKLFIPVALDVLILFDHIFFLHFQQQSLIAEAEVPEGAIEEEVAAATAVGSTVALNGGPQKAADGDLEVGSGTGILIHLGAKLCDWAVGQAGAGCYSWAAMSSNDSKTRYLQSTGWIDKVMD